MAKAEMREMGIEEDLITLATGTAESEDEKINEARALFRSLNAKYKEQIAPEARAVCEAGGLFILGTERHESRRIDNQLRGRSGRQGDPGESRFYLSLEDDLMRLFGSERILDLVSHMGLPDDMPIDARILSGAIETAQKRLEDQNFKRRKYVLAYDDIMNQQRTIIYNQRKDVLDGDDISATVRKMMERSVRDTVATFTGGESVYDWDLEGLRDAYLGMLTEADDFDYTEDELRHLTSGALVDELLSRAEEKYREKEEMFSLMVNDPNIPVDDLSKITAQTLIMAGTEDMIPEEHTRMIAENIAGSRLEFVEGDHFIAAGNPKEFNSIVLGFLR
jgi:preprotein translocase subunit SecA